MKNTYQTVLSIAFALLLMVTMWTVSVYAEGEKTEPETEKSPFIYEIVEDAVTITGTGTNIRYKPCDIVGDYLHITVSEELKGEIVYFWRMPTSQHIPSSMHIIPYEAVGIRRSMLIQKRRKTGNKRNMHPD